MLYLFTRLGILSQPITPDKYNDQVAIIAYFAFVVIFSVVYVIGKWLTRNGGTK